MRRTRSVFSLMFAAVSATVIVVTTLAAAPHTRAADETPAGQPAALSGHPLCAGISAETPRTPECDALIAAQPAPNVSRLPVDFGVLSDSRFIRFPASTTEIALYDKPGGQVIDTLTTGFTYVTVRQFNDDWTWAEIRPGRWVPLTDTREAWPTDFRGVQIHGMEMPFAFVLWRHCPAAGPGRNHSCDNGPMLDRFDVVNIYATVNVGGWDWHLIGPGLWTNQQNLSIVYPQAPAQHAGRWVAVNTYEQTLVAYQDSTPVMATLVSTGVENGEWNTWPGTFSVRLKIEKGKMDGEHQEEDYYSLDDVPYHMYFNGLIALHGAYWHNSFGYPHSHGCVNLSLSDSKWLYEQWVQEGTTVVVYSSNT